MVHSEIIGVGRYIPEKILTNADLEDMVDTSNEWIIQRTGIEERRIAGDNEDTSMLGYFALIDALANAEMNVGNLDLIIDATNTSRRRFPCSAGNIHALLDTKKKIPFFDLAAGCTGINYALATADAFIRSGIYETIAVVANEKLSEVTDYTDRSTCVLFGDAGGAMILGKSSEAGFISHELGGDGTLKEYLTDDDHLRINKGELQIQKNGKYVPLPIESLDDFMQSGLTLPRLQMKGNPVFRFAVPKLYKSIMKVVDDAIVAHYGITKDNLKIIPHQANYRIIDNAIEKLVRKWKLAEEWSCSKDILTNMFYITLPKRGNTSTASQPDAFCEAVETGWINSGDYVVFVGFGAGMTWGANITRCNKQLVVKDNSHLFKKYGNI